MSDLLAISLNATYNLAEAVAAEQNTDQDVPKEVKYFAYTLMMMALTGF